MSGASLLCASSSLWGAMVVEVGPVGVDLALMVFRISVMHRPGQIWSAFLIFVSSGMFRTLSVLGTREMAMGQKRSA